MSECKCVMVLVNITRLAFYLVVKSKTCRKECFLQSHNMFSQGKPLNPNCGGWCACWPAVQTHGCKGSCQVHTWVEHLFPPAATAPGFCVKWKATLSELDSWKKCFKCYSATVVQSITSFIFVKQSSVFCFSGTSQSLCIKSITMKLIELNVILLMRNILIRPFSPLQET